MNINNYRKLADFLDNIDQYNYIVNNYNDEEILEIIKKLEETSNNKLVLGLFTNENLKNNRSFSQILFLIDLLKNSNFNQDVYKIIINMWLLKLRNFDEHVELIKVFIMCEYDKKVYDDIMDPTQKTFKSQLKDLQRYIPKKTFGEVISKIDNLSVLKQYLSQLEIQMPNVDIGMNTIVPVYVSSSNDCKKN